MTISGPLFPPSLISPEIAASLPAGYTIRPLEHSDHARGFLQCLADLTWIGDYSEEEFYERYDWLATKGKDWYYNVVIDDGSRIVATATLIVERKFIHNRGLVGHIEEVVVSNDQQGKGLGLILIRALDSIAVNVGCYKSILDCADQNSGFYTKCGYENAGLEMAHYYEPFKTQYERG
ncbi:acyl-CoA N-acyltransferase [Talaromyces proteolyticus]|uniref:Glucosamine 6-phosphate N-acetyltransferase n=1 Tax=Talaromyces proteolyticus TaxID=1131652 RepID=A0AAD4KLE7_9EURO|nr:acyl-CoA N-acyltransferase [Talaromyces proteolyticus]KAH8691182.1 acyl-CoA N-acyltransferase [Talaromyces proteolyticus]